jgi:hypothetical protein
MRFPLHPVIDRCIIETNLLFGVDIVHRWVPSAADREVASRFDIAAEIEKANREIKEYYDLRSLPTNLC